MLTVDRIKDLSDVESILNNYPSVLVDLDSDEKVDGEKEAIKYFKDYYEENNEEWSDDLVKSYGPKKIQVLNDDRETYTFYSTEEFYLDSGSEDYFFVVTKWTA